MRWALLSLLLSAAAVEAAPYDWCAGEGYPLTDQEHAWCDVEPAPGADACPDLRSACAHQRADLSYNRAGYPKRRLHKERRMIQRGSGRGGLNVIFWVILGVGLVIVLGLLWRHRGELSVVSGVGGLGEPSLRRARPDASTLERPDALREAAFEAAGRGDYTRAFALLHRALLWGLHDAQRVRLHRAHTHGDYLRQLRSAPQLRRQIRPIFTLVDAVEFGGVAVGLAEWTALQDRVEALPPLAEEAL
ncbi:DUF4129 domain-containing protein [Myxococcota bacterium]|nr:DUF4129 domain-containing protein [Myxococcota bacterium]MBU1897034.1 DUF4129 domain-containing protein [Myxococcota bacterium]